MSESRMVEVTRDEFNAYGRTQPNGDRYISTPPERYFVSACERCGEADVYGSHYDAWSDWGDGVGPDGWICAPDDESP